MPIFYKAAAIGQSLIDGQEVHKVKLIFFFFSPARTQRARAPAHASTQHYGNTQTSTESQTYNRTLSHQVLLANHHREWA